MCCEPLAPTEEVEGGGAVCPAAEPDAEAAGEAGIAVLEPTELAVAPVATAGSEATNVAVRAV